MEHPYQAAVPLAGGQAPAGGQAAGLWAPQPNPHREGGSSVVIPHRDDVVDVQCKGTKGTLLITTQAIVCWCPACLPTAGPHGGRVMTPTEFERHAGMSASKKWRRSIKVMLGGTGRGSIVSVGRWLEQNGFVIIDKEKEQSTSNELQRPVPARAEAKARNPAHEHQADRLANNPLLHRHGSLPPNMHNLQGGMFNSAAMLHSHRSQASSLPKSIGTGAVFSGWRDLHNREVPAAPETRRPVQYASEMRRPVQYAPETRRPVQHAPETRRLVQHAAVDSSSRPGIRAPPNDDDELMRAAGALELMRANGSDTQDASRVSDEGEDDREHLPAAPLARTPKRHAHEPSPQRPHLEKQRRSINNTYSRTRKEDSDEEFEEDEEEARRAASPQGKNIRTYQRVPPGSSSRGQQPQHHPRPAIRRPFRDSDKDASDCTTTSGPTSGPSGSQPVGPRGALPRRHLGRHHSLERQPFPQPYSSAYSAYFLDPYAAAMQHQHLMAAAHMTAPYNYRQQAAGNSWHSGGSARERPSPDEDEEDETPVPSHLSLRVSRERDPFEGTESSALAFTARGPGLGHVPPRLSREDAAAHMMMMHQQQLAAYARRLQRGGGGILLDGGFGRGFPPMPGGFPMMPGMMGMPHHPLPMRRSRSEEGPSSE